MFQSPTHFHRQRPSEVGLGLDAWVTFAVIDHNGGEPDQAGGACFTTEWDQGKGVLFCLVMGRYGLFDSIDNVQGYEITPFARWPATGVSACPRIRADHQHHDRRTNV